MVNVSYPKTFLIDMPTADEMRTLFKVATIAHKKLLPQFASETDEREFYAGFVSAFEVIASWHRQPGLSKQRVDFWCDRVNRWLHERGESIHVNPRAFMLAIIAAGDIDYTIERWPYDAYCSLTFDSTARRPTASWKTILTTRQTRAPVQLDTPYRVAR